MPKTISEQTYNQAEALAENGKTLEAWSVLAAAGDNYAARAVDIIDPNSDTFTRELVETTWDYTVGHDTFVEKFDSVANLHVRGYLATFMTENTDGSITFNGNLPNTIQIETSYAQALTNNNVSHNASVDALLNSMDSGVTPHWANALDIVDGHWNNEHDIDSSRISTEHGIESEYSAAEATAMVTAIGVGSTINEASDVVDSFISSIFDFVDSSINDAIDRIDLQYFDQTPNALSPWQNTNIFNYNSQGNVAVNDPFDSFFTWEGLFGAESKLFQDHKKGAISDDEFRAMEDFVLSYTLSDLEDNSEAYTGDKPASKRAFYTVVTDEDNAPGLADKTGPLVNSDNQFVTAAQLQALDSDNDGELSGGELSGLKYWQDLNENGYLTAA